MENIILTNNKDLRLVGVKVGVLSTLRFELPLVSASATHVEVIVTSGNVHSAYTATFIDATKRWQCDIAASQFPAVGKQSYEVAYVLDGKQFWDGKGWIEIEDATTSGIEPQPRPEPYRYVVVSVNGYGADAQGAVRIPKTFIATDSPVTTEGYMEGDIYFNRETGATWTLCDVQGTLTWVFNYKNYYTKEETDQQIDRVAAYYITYDAAGNPFPTYAALADATTVYSGGKVRVPTRNDYCVVLADEMHQGAEYRYIYAVAEGQTTGSWQPQFPVEGVMTVDQTVIKNSTNPVAGGGVWSAIWGMASTAFSSIYDWVVAQIAKLRDKTDLNVYSLGNASVTFPDGFSITYDSETYTAPSGGESIEFYGPIESTSETGYYFWVPYEYKDDTDFNPVAQNVWCLTRDKYLGAGNPTLMLFATTSNYIISDWNATAPTLTLSTGEVTGGAPTMARPLGATGDTLAKVSQMNTALAGKANRAPNPTDGNLAALDSNGNPTDSGKTPYDFALTDIIADEWDFNSTYGVGDLCTSFDNDPSHMGTWLYKCILAPAPQQMMPPEIDTTHWTLATVEDVLAALRTALDGKANTSDLNAKLDSTSAAPAFSSDSSTQYAVGSHCTYQGKLYKCTTATTGGTWVAGSWTADTMTDPDAVLDITAQNQLRVVAKDGTLLWAQGYDLASTSSATLACDAVNNFTFADGATTQAFTLPTAPTGKVGDFGLDIDNSANTGAATMTLTGLDTTFSVVVPEGESLNDMLAIAAGELARFYITLSTFRVNNLPTWHILKQVVENGGAQS